MTNSQQKHDLNSSQIEEALAILNKEKDANSLSRRQKIIFLLLNVSVFGLLALLVPVVFMQSYPPLIDVLGPIFVLMLPLLFVLNLPLLWKQWRQMKLIRKLGLQETLEAPWQQMRKSRKVANATTIAFACLGVLMLLLVLAAYLGGSSQEEETDLLIGTVVFFVIALSFFSIYYVRRNRQKLEIVARLQETLTGGGSAAARMEIPREDYQLIATIERAQISRDRIRSIAESLDAPAVYSVRKSDVFREAAARLDRATRSKVENQIDDFVTQLQAARRGSEGRTATALKVPDTPLEISYVVDEQHQQIQIIGLQARDVR